MEWENWLPGHNDIIGGDHERLKVFALVALVEAVRKLTEVHDMENHSVKIVSKKFKIPTEQAHKKCLANMLKKVPYDV